MGNNELGGYGDESGTPEDLDEKESWREADEEEESKVVPPGERCADCGMESPIPVELHHSEQECEANRIARRLPVAIMDSRPLVADLPSNEGVRTDLRPVSRIGLPDTVEVLSDQLPKPIVVKGQGIEFYRERDRVDIVIEYDDGTGVTSREVEIPLDAWLAIVAHMAVSEV